MSPGPKVEQADLLEGTEYAPRAQVFRGWTFRPALDAARLENAQARVLRQMLNERWHTIEELRAVGGSSGDRRARQLRDPKLGGFDVEVKRASEVPREELPQAAQYLAPKETSGVWLYRIRPGSITRDQVSTFIQAVGGKRLLG